MISLTPNCTPEAVSLAERILQMVTDPVAARARLDEIEAATDNATRIIAEADAVKAAQTEANLHIADREAAVRGQLSEVLLREHDVAERENVCTTRETEIKRRWAALVDAIGDYLK